MNFDEIARLHEQHPAWVLLRSRNAPLVLGFLGRVFIERNSGGLPAAELTGLLDDELFALGQRLGEDRFKRSPQAYLDEWTDADHGWLRKYYPPGSDEPHYEPTPAVEQALLWVADLRPREVIGTESRLSTMFELLRQMVYGAEEDPEQRLVELRRRRAELDAEIAKTERGEVDLLDPLQQRDRFFQFTRNARELLADLRQVEDNLRSLDRDLRARIAGWTGSKGDLLDDLVTNRSGIQESDQGRSFQALNDFLLSRVRQDELTHLLARLARVEALAGQDQRLATVHFDWIEAGERTQSTVRQLSEQLRRFLDDRVWLDSRRVFELLRGIEANALALRDQPARSVPGMDLEGIGVDIALPFERPLYTPRQASMIDSSDVEVGDEALDATALYEQVYVDRDELSRRVRDGLLDREQVALSAVVETQPLEHGLAELVGYLSLVDPAYALVFDDRRREPISWDRTEEDEVRRTADVPALSYVRHHPGEAQ